MGKASDRLFEIADRPDASEHSIQAAYFAWCAMARVSTGDQRYAFIHAIPNGGDRDKVVAALMKAEGVRRGIADVCLPFYTRRHPFGYLEFKRPIHRNEKDGGLSSFQVDFRDFVLEQRGFFRTVYSWGEAREATLEYFATNAK